MHKVQKVKEVTKTVFKTYESYITLDCTDEGLKYLSLHILLEIISIFLLTACQVLSPLF